MFVNQFSFPFVYTLQKTTVKIKMIVFMTYVTMLTIAMAVYNRPGGWLPV
jgi:hypothetical protein